jgi:hypothetical protein
VERFRVVGAPFPLYGAKTMNTADREALAQKIVDGHNAVCLKDMEEDIRALWKEFDAAVRAGESIKGCRTKTEFCEQCLDRSIRSVQYMLTGGNKKRRETVSLMIVEMNVPYEAPTRSLLTQAGWPVTDITRLRSLAEQLGVHCTIGSVNCGFTVKFQLDGEPAVRALLKSVAALLEQAA